MPDGYSFLRHNAADNTYSGATDAMHGQDSDNISIESLGYALRIHINGFVTPQTARDIIAALQALIGPDDPADPTKD